MRFKNKIAVVTGAETGIGESVVKKLLSEGCKVIGTNFSKKKIKNKKNVKKTQKEIGGQKGPEPTRYGDWEKNGRVTDF